MCTRLIFKIAKYEKRSLENNETRLENTKFDYIKKKYYSRCLLDETEFS